MTRKLANLEVEPPSAVCGYCRFTSALHGTFSVEDGRLVWRAEADPQPSRGPDLERCCEGHSCGDFAGVEVTDSAGGWVTRELAADDVATLRETARKAWDA